VAVVNPFFAEASLLGIAFWATLAAWFIYVTALLVRERAGQDDLNSSRFLLVCTVGALVLGFLAAYSVPAAAFGGPTVAVIGLAATWAGLVLGEWGRRSLGRHYHPVVAIDEDHTVVTDGPYRLVRHPIYAGRLLSLAGRGVAMTNWWSLGSCLVLPLCGFWVRIRVEEKAMLDATGEAYAVYCQQTWRLLPHIW